MSGKIEFIVMDVDGTMTDGRINMGPSGEVFKSFDVRDGYAIHDMLPKANIIPVIITGRNSDIVERRARETGVKNIYQGVSDKLKILKGITADLSHVAYIGDDLNDYECMRELKAEGGVVGCPADAVDVVKELSDFVSSKDGGCGAVREFIEWIIKQ